MCWHSLHQHPSSLDKRCMSGKIGKCESSMIKMSRGGRFMQTFISISASSLSHHLLFWPPTSKKLNSLLRLTWTEPSSSVHSGRQSFSLPASFGKQPPSSLYFTSNLFDKPRWNFKWYRNLKAGMFCLAESFTRENSHGSKYNSRAVFILFKCLRTLHLTEDNRLENCLYKMQEVVAVFSGMWYCFALRWHPYGCSHPSPCPITLSLPAFCHEPLDHHISISRTQEMGAHGAAFGLLKVVILPYADGQKSGGWNSLLKSVLDPRMDIAEIYYGLSPYT